jgi:hypothetical protein
MTYNRKRIMRRAWQIVKTEYGKYNAINMRYALHRAWSEAKAVVRAAMQTPDEKLRFAIRMIENKSRVTLQDFARIGALQSEISALGVAA